MYELPTRPRHLILNCFADEKLILMKRLLILLFLRFWWHHTNRLFGMVEYKITDRSKKCAPHFAHPPGSHDNKWSILFFSFLYNSFSWVITSFFQKLMMYLFQKQYMVNGFAIFLLFKKRDFHVLVVLGIGCHAYDQRSKANVQ